MTIATFSILVPPQKHLIETARAAYTKENFLANFEIRITKENIIQIQMFLYKQFRIRLT